MEFDDIWKRLEWLDEQQRKGKIDLGDVNTRLAALETSVNALTQQLKGLGQQLMDLAPLSARVNQFDQMLSKQRTDLAKSVETVDKNAVRRDQESTKVQAAQLEEIRKAIFQLGTTINTDETFKKDRVHEVQRLTLAIQDVRTETDSVAQLSKELLERQKVIEESRRPDAKRVADLQGEVAAARKLADEAREKASLHTDAIRNMENRVSELLATDVSRHESQAAFLQQQALAQVERDHAWKEWQEKSEDFKQQAENVESQVVALDESIRAAKRAQDAYTDLNQKLERRIAEVGEMQRLAEDRVRQEWVAFKADEQKRWTGYSLAQDESTRDVRKDLDRMDKLLTSLDDAAQTLQDQLHQTTDSTEKQLREIMNVAHEWLSSFERIMGHAKTKAKKTAP